MRSSISTPAIVGVVVVVVVAAAGVAFFALAPPAGPPQNSTTMTTTTTTSPSTSSSKSSSSQVTPDVNAVKTDLNSLLKVINARDPVGASQFYTQDAVVNWTGNAYGLQGNYAGRFNVELLYASSISKASALIITGSNVQSSVAGNNVVLSFDIFLNGTSSLLGKFNATVVATQTWIPQSNTWALSKEVWAFKQFNVENALQATVFPQWGLSLSGRNPDLASEHVIEWRSAPFLALWVYVSILAIGGSALLLRLRKGARVRRGS